ncbi:MAG: hypothetical protein AAFZ15_24365 [Bacteroidota bacterium]
MNYKIAAWLLVVFLVFLITCYVHEFDYIGNTIQYRSLIWKSLAGAFVFGNLLGWYFHKRGEEQVDRIRIWSAALLLPLFFAPWLGSFTNRVFIGKSINYQTMEFLEERPFAASAYGFLKDEEIKEDGCYLFVFYKRNIHRLKRPSCEFYEKSNGDQITLPVMKGFWGYEFIPIE